MAIDGAWRRGQNMGEISNQALTQLPAQEKCWRDGKMEIMRSQLSQGPRGCSVQRRSDDPPEKFSS